MRKLALYFRACLLEALLNFVSFLSYIFFPEWNWSQVLAKEAAKLDAKSVSNQLWAAMLIMQSALLIAVFLSQSKKSLRDTYRGMLAGEVFVFTVIYFNYDFSRINSHIFVILLTLFALWRIWVLYQLRFLIKPVNIYKYQQVHPKTGKDYYN